jgi:phosphoribosylanthranilate isomerase
MVKIKVSSVSNLTDARYFAAKEVAWLGFCLQPGSSLYITPSNMLAIREWVGGVLSVGEFGMASGDDLMSAAVNYRLDAVQVGMFTPLETLESLQGQTTIFREVVVQPDSTASSLRAEIQRAAHLVENTVLSFLPGRISWRQLRAGKPFDVEELQALCHDFQVFLELQWDSATLEEALRLVKPYGIVLHGGDEEKTGVKSFDELDELFEILE